MNVNITDIEDSVETCEKLEPIILNYYINHLSLNVIPVKLPKLSVFDYDLINKDTNTFNSQIEIKVRTKYYEETILPTNKEIEALNDHMTKGKTTLFITYSQDVREINVYDIVRTPPIRRELVTRRDRDITYMYSFYNKPILTIKNVILLGV